MRANTARHLINLWPPFLFTGIHATRIAADWRQVDVELRARWYTRNYVGTHFGGSMFAMTDPWFMLMLIHLMGPEYYVWDQAARIDFIKPGRGRLTARFALDDATLADIRARTADGAKYLPEFEVDIRDDADQVVARVHKTLYVRRKPAARG
ncbi:DUF4442 domain-containing protein [Chitiniphilus shinanonensis]|uniref:DUF4442 domain-containing protein n=1 Tax=Chitiniphilus shinanonensis TaxID=553088 RepID=A0ABQ6BU18_9NEIS|nr:DUF4442 domain-containing protein [Chitiniphilus shinanonensis]GLS03393.1 DUF4442 domain-containing protein [Chitiniphilus shinanonensis]